jgi:hypothetical protein
MIEVCAGMLIGAHPESGTGNQENFFEGGNK